MLVIPFLKTIFWKTHFSNRTFVFVSLQYKFQVEIIPVSQIGHLVCIGLKLMQLVDEIEHDIMHYQNRGLSYRPKVKMTQT